jgi:hypothetical protein
MSRNFLFTLYWRSEFWLQALSEAISEVHARGGKATVLDVSDYDFPRQMPFHNGHFIHSSSKPNPGLVSFFGNMGVPVYRLSTKTARTRPFIFSAEIEENLEIAVESTSRSLFRDDFEDGKSLFTRVIENRIKQRALRAGYALHNFLADGNYTDISINNGRFATQRMLAEVAKINGLNLSYMEQSEFPNRFFWRAYRPHQRTLFQNDALANQAKLSRKFTENAVSIWVQNRRKTNSTSNPFSKLWLQGAIDFKQIINAKDNRARTIITLFTSSSDEFESLGDEWKLGAWVDQYDAFDKLLTGIDAPGLQPILRVHPNRMNKSLGVFLRERRKIMALTRKHEKLRVVWHNSRISSYELVGISDAIVVQNSTLGLEASLEGKPVICLDACWYDLVADVTPVHRQSQIQEIDLKKKPNKSMAEVWVAHQLYKDKTLSHHYDALIKSYFPKVNWAAVAWACISSESGLALIYEIFRRGQSKVFSKIPTARHTTKLLK